MENQIIDIEYEDGIISIAKIIKGHGSEYDIATLRYYGDDEWNFDMEELETIIKKIINNS